MKINENINLPGGGERGMALISALLLLLVISLLSVGLSMDSSMDVRIAGYQRVNARSFAATEAGMKAANDILEDNISEGGWGTAAVDFPNKSTYYTGDIAVLLGDFYMQPNSAEVTVLTMTGEITADIIAQRLNSMFAQGSAIQVAAGYGGGGGKAAAAGGGNVIYNLQAKGGDVVGGVGLANKNLGVTYRYVTATK